MDDHFPNLPTMPMPSVKPPRKRRILWLVVLLIVSLLLVFGIGASILGKILGPARSQISSTQTIRVGIATQTGQVGATATPTTLTAPAGTPTQITPTPKPIQRPTPTPTPPLSSVTHGRPHLGGLFSDFVGAYGTPTDQGDSSSQNFLTGPNQTIEISALKNEQGVVTQLNILGPTSWTSSQTQNYCVQFLPDNTVQFNTSGNITEYHSSAGDVTLQLQSSSVCLLSFAHS